VTFWSRLLAVLRAPRHVPPRLFTGYQVRLSRDCLREIQACIQTDLIRRHEGVCYLLGRIAEGRCTTIVEAVRPDAVTTPGSFHVDSLAMAAVVRLAARRQLQVVGQLHTHPGIAYHSEGDERGVRIRYRGYVSIVLPDYGSRLPSLQGIAIFVYEPGAGFVPLSAECVRIAQDGWYA
jgi:proteasome lid subunit RPN8/RPN11